MMIVSKLNKYSSAFKAALNLKGFTKCLNDYSLTDRVPNKHSLPLLEKMD